MSPPYIGKQDSIQVRIPRIDGILYMILNSHLGIYYYPLCEYKFPLATKTFPCEEFEIPT
jgi:hypothetical protein